MMPVALKMDVLFKAFYDQLEVLKNKNALFAERQEALWFIGHFVGDIHQPMHVGYPRRFRWK